MFARTRVWVMEPCGPVREAFSSLINGSVDFEAVSPRLSGSDSQLDWLPEKADVAVIGPGWSPTERSALLRRCQSAYPTLRCIIIDPSPHRDRAAYRPEDVVLGPEGTSGDLLDAVRRTVVGSHEKQLFERYSKVDTSHLLTPREHEVLKHLAQGMSNKQISRAMIVTEGTVKTHVHHILRKLQVEDRTGAVVHAIRRGWIRP